MLGFGPDFFTHEASASEMETKQGGQGGREQG
jgi:hypothetical protein